MTTIAANSKTTKKRMAEKSKPAAKTAKKAPKPQIKVKEGFVIAEADGYAQVAEPLAQCAVCDAQYTAVDLG